MHFLKAVVTMGVGNNKEALLTTKLIQSRSLSTIKVPRIEKVSFRSGSFVLFLYMVENQFLLGVVHGEQNGFILCSEQIVF